MHRSLFALALSAFASALPAHPHVFVEARVAIVFDPEGRMTGVRLTWVYDDFFSFLITAEVGAIPMAT